MNILKLDSVESTNSWTAARRGSLPMPSMVVAVAQTAGRGQRGNSWESEPGKNLTASFLFRPEGIEPASQFAVSEAVALAVVDFLNSLGIEASVKWPNDIYVADRKISGILIENSILGREITSTVAGVGINLNQEKFLSDAPNPVSAIQLTGQAVDPDEAATSLAEMLEKRLDALADRDTLHGEYLSKLWRSDGRFHPFSRRDGGGRFMARIAGVAPDGFLDLETASGQHLACAFKEVEFILTDN